MTFLLPLLPLFVAVLIIGAKIGLLTHRSFLALAKELEEQAHPLDSAKAVMLMKRWHANPASVVLDTDPDEVRTIKLAHASAFVAQVKPWKIAARVATIAGAVIGVVLYSLR
jgi:hypothetical protein